MTRIEIPQPIPNEICLACDICCRFPERDSFLSPFFTDEEIQRATSLRKERALFRPIPPSEGGQIIPVPWDSGYRCPFFDPETHFCKIYREHPLDCQLYPYALMVDPTSSGVWLGIDTKCPATDDSDTMERLVTSAARIWEASMSSNLIELLEATPRLVGPHQPDVLPLFRLEELTEALLSVKRLIPWRSPSDAFSGSFSRGQAICSSFAVRPTHPLTLADRAVAERYFSRKKARLASQTSVMQFMARDLISTVWCEVEGFFCLWAFDSGTVYMPLPPVGPADFRRILPQCFAFMDHHNAGAGISRVENLSLSDIPKDLLAEFDIRPGYPDYLYQRDDLLELRGRAFRGKRSDCRAFGRNPGIEYRPYRPPDEAACTALFERWQAHRMGKTADSVLRKLLEDSRSYHLSALTEGEAIGLIGRVICVRENMVAYTFGFPLDGETFVVALEVTDPSYRGASAYIFHEFSRELEAYKYINVMDDSGLPGLKRVKRSYHPWRLEPSFVLSRK